MFDSLRLSIIVTMEVLTDILVDVAADVTIKAITSRLGYYFGGLDTN